MASRLPSRLASAALALTVASGGLCLTSTANAETSPAPVSPKNVIVLIGDGMGFNHVDLYNAFTTGKVHYQVERGGDHKVNPYGYNSTKPTTGFQSWDLVGMETSHADGSYNPATAWIDFPTNKDNPTDSGAAGTAMATGVKTYNGAIGVGPDRAPRENLAERAISLGKAAGVVTNVPYSHATPADYSVHNVSRKDYAGIAHSQLTSKLSVVMGAGHPAYDDNHELLAKPKYSYISENDFANLSQGRSDFTYIESKADFESLAAGKSVPERVFGITQVGSTNQQGRSEGRPMNDVPSLSTMTRGALNVLNKDKDGFFLMVEGGAIDWAGHANQSDRDIEEVTDFVDMVNMVEDWVEANSSWDDTLVMVTADHETGYLSGSPEGDFTPIAPTGIGQMPAHSWNSGDHTNQLVGMWFKGAGSSAIHTAAARNLDPVRGAYIANTDPARWLLDSAWVVQPAQPEKPAEGPGTSQPGAGDGELDGNNAQAGGQGDANNGKPSTDTQGGGLSATDAKDQSHERTKDAKGKQSRTVATGELAKTGASGMDLLPVSAGLFLTAAAILAIRRLIKA